MEKMTKREMFAEIVALATANEREDIKAFCEHEIELLAKKAGKSTPTKAQKENVELVEKVYNALVIVGRPVTATELLAEMEPIEGVTSNQKLSALLKKLVDGNRVTKTVEKKKSYFSIAEIA